jgi:hypothetical protein
MTSKSTLPAVIFSSCAKVARFTPEWWRRRTAPNRVSPPRARGLKFDTLGVALPSMARSVAVASHSVPAVG